MARRDPKAPTARASQRRAGSAAGTPRALPAGRFHHEGCIASGGQGAVHAVRDRTLLRRSAMKILAPELQSMPSERQRFIEEAQIAAQLEHPHIVPIHELDLTHDGDLYFTMKLIEGHTLSELLKQIDNHVRTFSLIAPLIDVLIKVCDAVAFAHSRGIIHRDIKPANIMVGSFGQVYVMDWGIARVLQGRTDVVVSRDRDQPTPDRRGIPLGTPSYMPPEQAFARHDETDERSDVFALGATLYQILTGEAPYRYNANDLDAMVLTAQRCEITPAEKRSATAWLPRGLSRIAMKALAADPSQRYPTATAFKDDLVAQMRGGADLPCRIYKPGEMVVVEGSPGDAAYVVVSGTCHVFKTVQGKHIALRNLGPGDVFGETAILSQSPRTASVQALETSVLQVVSRELLEEQIGLSTNLLLFVRALAERFREADERLSWLTAELQARR